MKPQNNSIFPSWLRIGLVGVGVPAIAILVHHLRLAHDWEGALLCGAMGMCWGGLVFGVGFRPRRQF